MDGLRELIPGETQIGAVTSKDKDGLIRDFQIYYGNVAAPIIDGEVLHLKEERYREMLKEFLLSDIGQEYEEPTEEEIKAASIEMLNRETKAKAYREKIQKGQQDKTEEDNTDTKETGQSSETFMHDTDSEHEDSSVTSDHTETDDGSAGPVFKTGINPEPEPKEFNVKAMLACFLIVLLLAGNIFQYLVLTGMVDIPLGREMRTEEKDTQMAELAINGKTYTVPLQDMTVADGEGKITIYGITTYSENGEVHSSAMPLGEFRIDPPAAK